MTEVVLAGGLGAVLAHAELSDVEVALKDLILGVLLLQRHRDLHLAQLAPNAVNAVGFLGGLDRLVISGLAPSLDEHVLHVLLREC